MWVKLFTFGALWSLNWKCIKGILSVRSRLPVNRMFYVLSALITNGVLRPIRPCTLCLKVGRGNATIITIQILQPRTASAGLLSLICCNRQRLSSLCTRLNVRFTLHPATAGVGLCCFLLSSVFNPIVATLNSVHFLSFPYIRELEIPYLCRLVFFSCIPTYKTLRLHIPHNYIIINGIKFGL